jgi:hypothetical protein
MELFKKDKRSLVCNLADPTTTKIKSYSFVKVNNDASM